MPEGDTVWLHAARLDAVLRGRVLTVADFRVPRLATVDLRGRTVLEVVARGKHLLHRFDDGRTLHTHLRMDGTWRVFDAGRRWSGGPGWQIRVILGSAEHITVGYRLPVVELVPTRAEHTVVGHLGPDLLSADWNSTLAADAVARLGAARDRAVGLALLDQTLLAGLGNLYRCELCFLRGVSPWTPVGEVPDLPGVVALAHRLLVANRGRWEQVTTGSTRRGERHWVFERTGEPCRRCGTAIRCAPQGAPATARLTYWCPRCQPGPQPPS